LWQALRQSRNISASHAQAKPTAWAAQSAHLICAYEYRSVVWILFFYTRLCDARLERTLQWLLDKSASRTKTMTQAKVNAEMKLLAVFAWSRWFRKAGGRLKTAEGPPSGQSFSPAFIEN